MEIDLKCCGKDRIKLEEIYGDMNINSRNTFICVECGSLLEVLDVALDFEELRDLLKNNADIMQDTEIYKQIVIKGED